MDVRTVAVIGAGELGRRLAALFAGAGYETILEDVLPSNLRVAARDLEDGDAATPGQTRQVRFATNVEDAVRTADLVIDCVPDELESKLEIFSLLDRMAPPKTIFATPTRTLSIDDLASCTYRDDRCVALHLPEGFQWMEAPGAAIGVVQTSRTAPAVRDAVVEFWESPGFHVELSMDTAEPDLLERKTVDPRRGV